MAADTTAEKPPGIPVLSLQASNMFSTEHHQFRQAWASSLVLNWQTLPEWSQREKGAQARLQDHSAHLPSHAHPFSPS